MYLYWLTHLIVAPELELWIRLASAGKDRIGRIRVPVFIGKASNSNDS